MCSFSICQTFLFAKDRIFLLIFFFSNTVTRKIVKFDEKCLKIQRNRYIDVLVPVYLPICLKWA